MTNELAPSEVFARDLATFTDRTQRIRVRPLFEFAAVQTQHVTDGPPEHPDVRDWFDHVLATMLGGRFFEAVATLKAVAYKLSGGTDEEIVAVLKTCAPWSHLLDAEGQRTYAQSLQVYRNAVTRAVAEFEAHGFTVDARAAQ